MFKRGGAGDQDFFSLKITKARPSIRPNSKALRTPKIYKIVSFIKLPHEKQIIPESGQQHGTT